MKVQIGEKMSFLDVRAPFPLLGVWGVHSQEFPVSEAQFARRTEQLRLLQTAHQFVPYPKDQDSFQVTMCERPFHPISPGIVRGEAMHSRVDW